MCAGRCSALPDCDELMPEWHKLAKGGVVSEDLPMNTSNEALPQNPFLRLILKSFNKQRLQMFAEIAAKIGNCSKMCVQEDSTNRTQAAELVHFHTSSSGNQTICLKAYDRKQEGQNTSISGNLKEYVDRMREDHNNIYYTSVQSLVAAASSSKYGDTMTSLKEHVDHLQEGQNDIFSNAGESLAEVSLSLRGLSAPCGSSCARVCIFEQIGQESWGQTSTR